MNLVTQFILNSLVNDSAVITLTIHITETETKSYNFTSGFDRVLLLTIDGELIARLDFKETYAFIDSVLTNCTKYDILVDTNYFGFN